MVSLACYGITCTVRLQTSKPIAIKTVGRYQPGKILQPVYGLLFLPENFIDSQIKR